MATQPSPRFTENEPKKRKHRVSGKCVDENALLMREVREDRLVPDDRNPTLQPRGPGIASPNTQHVKKP